MFEPPRDVNNVWSAGEACSPPAPPSVTRPLSLDSRPEASSSPLAGSDGYTLPTRLNTSR